MQNKVLDTYTIRLIKENILHILLLIFFTVLIAVYIPLQVISYFDTVKKNGTLRTEVEKLRLKRDVVITFSPTELNRLVTTLNTLLPNKEDYFSILTTLENLSQKTGFSITSYTMSIAKKQNDVVQLSIVGEGSSQASLDFMYKYNSQGGRLVTIDKIEYSPNNNKVSLVLHFYSREYKKSDTKNITGLDKNTIKRLEGMSVNPQTETTSTDSGLPINYPAKVNPFE